MRTSSRTTRSIGEVAQVASVSVRTLHHYDAIGLLSPSGRSAAGYRRYCDADLERLHSILLLRALGLPLEEIRRVLDEPSADVRRVLRTRRVALLAQLEHTEAVLRVLDRTLETFETQGEFVVEKQFEGFDQLHAEEASARWGHTEAWAESKRRTRRYGPKDWARLQAESDQILAELVALMASGSAPEAAAEQVEAHRRHIERWFYPCPPAMHQGLAELYVSDARFTAHFDARAPGLAAYLAAAIQAQGE